MDKIDRDLFKTLGNKDKTYTDREFLLNLRDWIVNYTGNVNVAMRLFLIAQNMGKSDTRSKP